MAVISPARTRHTDYQQLTRAAQDVIDKAMQEADNAATTRDYENAMQYVALAAGIPLPASKDLAVCSCLNDAGGCGCGAIFDSNAEGVVITALHGPDRNLSELQCPTCGHDHPRPIND